VNENRSKKRTQENAFTRRRENNLLTDSTKNLIKN